MPEMHPSGAQHTVGVGVLLEGGYEAGGPCVCRALDTLLANMVYDHVYHDHDCTAWIPQFPWAINHPT